MKHPGVEIPRYKKGDRIRFCVEDEVEHILDSDTEVGRITYILDNGFVLLGSERDKGIVEIVGTGFRARLWEFLAYMFGGYDRY